MQLSKKKHDSKSLSLLLEKALKSRPEWHEICGQVIAPNATGNLYLIGGSVSRTLVQELYGIKQEGQDYDFVCDKLSSSLTVPEGWEVSYRKFGNPTFTKGNISVDLWEIKDADWIKDNKLEPTITNFFAGVHFTIQALAYDLRKRTLVGSPGIKALLAREFRVNNMATARTIPERKGVTIDERMKKKADSMGFTYVPCGE